MHSIRRSRAFLPILLAALASFACTAETSSDTDVPLPASHPEGLPVVKTPQTYTQEFYDANPAYVGAICVGWIKSGQPAGSKCLGNMRIPGSTAPPAVPSYVSSSTVFRIGSISKVFGASLLAAKKIDGSRNYDDPVVNWIIAQNLPPGDPKEDITLEDLATHASGFPNNPGAPLGSASTMEVWNAFVSTPLNAGAVIGSDYFYSNMGFGILGTALSDYNFYTGVTDTWEEQIQDRFATPLNLVDTKITVSTTVRDTRVPEVAGYSLDEAPAPGAAAVAGQYHSSINDMIAFLKWNLKLTLLGNADDGVVDEVRVEHDLDCYPGTSSCKIGLGWEIERPWPATGSKLYWKGGSLSYFRSWIGYTSTGNGVVVLIAGPPAPSGTAAPATLGKDILQSF